MKYSLFNSILQHTMMMMSLMMPPSCVGVRARGERAPALTFNYMYVCIWINAVAPKSTSSISLALSVCVRVSFIQQNQRKKVTFADVFITIALDGNILNGQK